ncbi:hypothetical protein DFP72DRAFT_1153403 [Ephemerocybe angulata]|uniref:Ubiquitin-like protease family profile domain-containing protein n=1 Tax=Ephemerocybe angulata TaxID=980116 RepID=A0A8H6LYM2_9AGAR|nr:hypothetical protein DFP72DRAFT_1153403 [Tulosesus angulatus]
MTRKISNWFTTDQAKTDLRILLNRPVPSSQTLKDLESELQSAWHDGCRSVSDPRYNDGRDRLPLYAITYWREVTKSIEQQALWKEAAEWVSDQHREWATVNGKGELVKDLGVFETLASILVSSKVPTRWGAVPAYSLAKFLGEKWMGTDNITFMLDTIVGRVAGDRRMKGKVWVMPPEFSQAIVEYGSSDSATAARGSRLLECHEKILASAHKVYAPFNINDCHWVAVCLDLTSGKVVYAFKKWVEDKLGRTISIGGDELKHAHQNDSHSCGLITANTIESNIFGDSLWTPLTAAEGRLMWFNLGGRLAIPRKQRAEAEKPPNPKLSIHHLLNPDVGQATHDEIAFVGEEARSTESGDDCGRVSDKAEVAVAASALQARAQSREPGQAGPLQAKPSRALLNLAVRPGWAQGPA